jgi:hypothetical protein
MNRRQLFASAAPAALPLFLSSPHARAAQPPVPPAKGDAIKIADV